MATIGAMTRRSSSTWFFSPRSTSGLSRSKPRARCRRRGDPRVCRQESARADHPERLPRGSRDHRAPDDSRTPGAGRSSGLRAFRANPASYCPLLPSAGSGPAPVPPWGSFSPTAAGQPRLPTGFPFSACANAQAPTHPPLYVGYLPAVNTICWGIWPILANAAEHFGDSSAHWSPGQWATFEQWCRTAVATAEASPWWGVRALLRWLQAGGTLLPHVATAAQPCVALTPSAFFRRSLVGGFRCLCSIR